jgi:molybdate-binding protein
VDQDKAELGVAKAQLVKDQANVIYTKINHEHLDLLFSQDSTSHDAVAFGVGNGLMRRLQTCRGRRRRRARGEHEHGREAD